MRIHIVKQGDTIYELARTYNVSVQRIISDNGLMYPYTLVLGQALIITIPATIHTVKAGESPFSIAVQNGISIQELYQNNPELSFGEPLYPGQVLVIQFEGEKRRTISVNGYAYPFVNRQVLRRTLPYLTYLSIFSYGMRDDGTLIMPDDEQLLAFSKTFQALPVLVLTSIDNGHFSTYLTKKLLNEPEFQETILNQLIQVMKEKGYRGLDSDFEFIPKEDAEAYIAFLSNARDKLHANGFFLHTALAPKTSATQTGLLYQGHIYDRIGEVSDRVLLMTYEWGYTYGPPMAVAPIDQVRNVIEYGVSEIPRENIFMGFPNYGYDWTLPFIRGTTMAKNIGNQEAVQIAAATGSTIQYDETAQSPFFTYSVNGVDHEVWFEDIRSIEAKYNLLDEFNLLGSGYWNVMRPFAQNWAFLSTRYNIKKFV